MTIVCQIGKPSHLCKQLHQSKLFGAQDWRRHVLIIPVKQSILCLSILFWSLEVISMDLHVPQITKPMLVNLQAFENSTYTCTHQSIEFEHAQHLVQSNEDVQKGILLLKNLASAQVPDVRAQLFLGKRAFAKQDWSKAEYYLGCASNWGHPEAQEHLGKLYLDKGNLKDGIAHLTAAAQPRCLSLAPHRYYYHLPAITFMAAWYGKNKEERLSQNAVYFTYLAAQFSKESHWPEHLRRLYHEIS